MKTGLIVFVLLLAGSLSAIRAQIEVMESNIDLSLLDDQIAKQFGKSQNLVTKANQYLQEAQKYEQEMNRLMNSEGRIKQGKINRYEGKRYYAILKARPYQFDAYKKIYNTLNDQINDYQEHEINAEAADLQIKAKQCFKQAKKFNRKSENSEKPDRIVDFVVLTGKEMRKAVDYQMDALKVLKAAAPVNNAPKTMKELLQSDSTAVTQPTEAPLAVVAVAAVDTTTLAPAVEPSSLTASTTTNASDVPAIVPAAAITTVAAVAPEDAVIPAVVAQPAAVRAPLTNVFITIQLMATKVSASAEEIKQAYSGSREVIEVKSSDYIRYVVGKFYTLDEAKAAMAAEGIKGIVVAFKDNERISVVEAARLIQE